MEIGNIFREPDSINTEDLHTLKGLQPLKDPVFQYLLGLALENRIPVYWAVVPMNLIHPFDKGYHPKDHPVGKIAIESVIEQWKEGASPAIWIYPEQDQFLMSDDYIYYEAAIVAGLKTLPCIVLGEAALPGVTRIAGPLSSDEVRKALGFG